LGDDGMYHSYLPRMAYSAGLTGPEIGAPQFPDCDNWMGALPLAEPFAAIDARDPRMMETLDDMEEMGTREFLAQNIAGRKKKGLPTKDAWFWTPYSRLPKASHVANAYLLQDDVPSFLRFWENAYASVVGADGRLWEPWMPGNFDDCKAPDNGTAGWFMENFRDLLAMEDGPDLWIAKATPRAWLRQGDRISVRHAPTYFGDLDYEIVSDVEHGRITARIETPSRHAARKIILRLRHPAGKRIKSVSVNGESWRRFDPAKETITLSGLSGRVSVVARY
ncbi:MAG TPA: hypothetical protein VMI31_10620, partial [Fimbriimonadaceae bacterium]|nr:hypothetical protein [Fimbriimonadaceae bacterium]